MDITVYTLEQVKPGSPEGGPWETEPWGSGDFETQDRDEAFQTAQEHGLLVIANTYEWSDSEPDTDFSAHCRECGVSLGAEGDDTGDELCAEHKDAGEDD